MSRLWMRIAVGYVDDPEVDELSDATFRAFHVALSRVATSKRPGRFESPTHARNLMGRHAEQLPELESAGLVVTQPDGSLLLPLFEEWRQADATAPERQRRHRARAKVRPVTAQSRTRHGVTRPLVTQEEEESSSSGAAQRTAAPPKSAASSFDEGVCVGCHQQFSPKDEREPVFIAGQFSGERHPGCVDQRDRATATNVKVPERNGRERRHTALGETKPATGWGHRAVEEGRRSMSAEPAEPESVTPARTTHVRLCRDQEDHARRPGCWQQLDGETVCIACEPTAVEVPA